MIKSYTRRLQISFSGGETSGYMAKRLIDAFRLDGIGGRYDEFIAVMANTGEENEETLTFAQRCDEAFGLDLKLVEFDIDGGFRLVDWKTASRNSEPFRDMISKYGIPNQGFPHCNRELKVRAITRYLRSIGWKSGTYDTAIGIRNDEIDRISETAGERKYVYPLATWWPTSKPSVNHWWNKQDFRLNLKSYQGNCKTCWKKSTRKLAMIARENPSHFDFFREMESKYALVGPEFKKEQREGYKRTFFRGNKTVDDIFEIERTMGHVSPNSLDDSLSMSLFDPDLDVEGACGSESCEIDFGGDTSDDD